MSRRSGTVSSGTYERAITREHLFRGLDVKYGFLAKSALGIAAAAAAALTPLKDEARAQGAPTQAALWAGIGFLEDVFSVYGGGVWAYNGDLDAEGVLFRGNLLYVDYEFDTALAPGGDADGDLYRANASVGYQVVGNGVTASVFGGIDYQDYDISPSAADNGRLDDEVGFIVTGRLATNGPGQFPASVEGNYSTANDSYWARARVGYRHDTITIGPEFGVLGNDDFDAIRIGGHVSANFGQYVLQVNGGYQDSDGGGSSGDDSAYGGVTAVLLY